MKRLGLLGGMSWESTSHYYQQLNRLARDRAGGQSSARLILWSVDFGPMAARMAEGDWPAVREELLDAARRLEAGGAEALVVCTNTMHKFAPDFEQALSIPLIHIADATASALKRAGRRRPLLLATRPTMEQDFYLGRLAAHGVDAAVPDQADRDRLHVIIFDELVQGVLRDDSRAFVLDVARRATETQGIDAIILGCTEFGLLTPPDAFALPAFDTTQIHCVAAMDWAMQEQD